MMTPAKILIIEDSIVSALMMEATINRKQPNYEVRIRKSLRGGLAEWARFAPHLVILDLSLPDAEPLVTMEAIATFKACSRVLVASGFMELEGQARFAGADDFMAKAIGEDTTPFMQRLSRLVPQ